MGTVPIIPVLEHYGAENLPETLRWRPVRCPFHDERNASASYIASDDGQAFNCHACGVRGDAISLVRQQEGLEYLEALEFLAGIVGQELDTGGPPPPKRYKPVRIGDTGTMPTVTPAPQRRRKKLRLKEE